MNIKKEENYNVKRVQINQINNLLHKLWRTNRKRMDQKMLANVNRILSKNQGLIVKYFRNLGKNKTKMMSNRYLNMQEEEHILILYLFLCQFLNTKS